MANERISMKNIKEILRMHEAGLNRSQIKRATKICRKTVREYITRAKAIGLTYALIQDKTESEVYELIFPQQAKQQVQPLPDWKTVHLEITTHKSVTIFTLWEEYIQTYPEGYKYSQFCDLYRTWRKTLDYSMRQIHKAGEKMFTDYSGMTMPVIDQQTGEVRQAEIYVSVLGASNYAYAEATWSQSLPDWINSHIRTFEYFGGVPEIEVPDNLKSGISKACRYEPDVNPAYQDMAMHYGIAVIPARPAAPKDKPKVENAVLVVQRWILAKLRKHTFFSLAELNQKIQDLLIVYNNKPFQKLEGCRRSAFEMLDKPLLKPLPQQRYEFAQWKKATVNIDYHIEVDGHYYSVPCKYVREKIDLKITSTTISLFHNNQQITFHQRSRQKGGKTTVAEHMPKSHKEYGEWTPERIMSWAESIGQSTRIVAERIIQSRQHPAQGYKSILGIIGLAKRYTVARVEAAAKRAVFYAAYSYQSIKSILEKELDKKPLEEEPKLSSPVQHENLRGSEYFDDQPALLPQEVFACQ
jgi:transposase